MTRPSRPDTGRVRLARPQRRVVPAWVVIPVAALAGFFVARWPGLVLGGVVGYFLYRTRR